jgi:hypothetical protein
MKSQIQPEVGTFPAKSGKPNGVKRLASSGFDLYNAASMLTGYNTDFKFQGKIYHVQTEDGGANNPNITSLLYHQGAILASRKTSYADILKADCLEEVVRELMIEQHKQMIRDLMKGKLTIQTAPKEAACPPAAPQADPAPTAAPAPETAPAAAVKDEPPAPKGEVKDRNLDDIILDFLAEEQKDRNRKK